MSVHPFPQGDKQHKPEPDRRSKAKEPGTQQPPDPPPGAAMARSWRRLRHEVGLGTVVLDRVQKEHAGDPFAQLVGFFDHFRIASATGRRRTVAFKTGDKYFAILRRVLNTLRELNMRNRNLGDLSLRQVRAVVRHWERNGASPSTLTTLSTTLRRFGCWIGKPQLGPPLATLLLDPGKAVRPTSAVTPKDWESRGIHPPDAVGRMRQECHVAAIQLHLGWAFGLRVQEQLMLRPHEAHRGDRLVLTHGTKGGRPREIELTEQWEYDLIEQAKAIAAAHPHGILARGTDRTLEQARSHYYYLCRRIGLRRGGRFDSTPHGARHSFAVRRYQRSGGVPAPVVGGTMPPAAIDRAARKGVAEELGHSRVAISSAYLGSVPNLGHALAAAGQAGRARAAAGERSAPAGPGGQCRPAGLQSGRRGRDRGPDDGSGAAAVRGGPTGPGRCAQRHPGADVRTAACRLPADRPPCAGAQQAADLRGGGAGACRIRRTGAVAAARPAGAGFRLDRPMKAACAPEKKPHASQAQVPRLKHLRHARRAAGA
jgi:integrase